MGTTRKVVRRSAQLVLFALGIMGAITLTIVNGCLQVMHVASDAVDLAFNIENKFAFLPPPTLDLAGCYIDVIHRRTINLKLSTPPY